MNGKKTIAATVCIMVWTGLCVFIFFQHSRIGKLQMQNSNTKMLCEELEEDLLIYEEKNQNISQELEGYEQLEKEIAVEMMLHGDVEQAFHGRWSVHTADEFYRHYLGIEDINMEVQETDDRLPALLFLDYHTQSISICGPRRIPITKEPRYRFRICRKEELFRELEHTEIGTEEIDKLLDKNYCVEMCFDDLKEWDRVIYPEEERFINAKYYPLNFDVMLCVPQDGSGELFFMRRFIDWNLEA